MQSYNIFNTTKWCKNEEIEVAPNQIYFLLLRDVRMNAVQISSTTTSNVSSTNPVLSQKCNVAWLPTNFIALENHLPSLSPSSSSSNQQSLSVDLSSTLRFHTFLNHASHTQRIVLYLYRQYHQKHQLEIALQLLCSWRMYALQLSPEAAFEPFEHMAYTIIESSRHDLNLGLVNRLKALEKAHLNRFFQWENPTIIKPIVPPNDLVWITNQFVFIPTSSGCSITLLQSFSIQFVLQYDHPHRLENEREYQQAGIHVQTYALKEQQSTNRFHNCLHFLRENFEKRCAILGGPHGEFPIYLSCHLMEEYHFSAIEAIAWIQYCYPVALTCVKDHWFLHQYQGRMERGVITKKHKYNETTDSTSPTTTNMKVRQILHVEGATLPIVHSPHVRHTAAATIAARRRPFTPATHRATSSQSSSTSSSNEQSIDVVALHKFLHPLTGSPSINPSSMASTVNEGHYPHLPTIPVHLPEITTKSSTS